MLYANFDLLVQKAAGGNRFLLVGEQGTNCRQVKIPVCKKFPGLLAHQMEKDFSFQRNEDSKWGIVAGGSTVGLVYLILSSKDSQACGRSYISQLATGMTATVIVRSNGVSEQSPYPGLWETLVIHAKHGDVFRVSWGSYRHPRADTLYLVWDHSVYCSDLVRFDRLSERLGYLPYNHWRWQNDELKINLRDWRVM